MAGDKVDTSTAIGKPMITVLSGIAEFEAGMIKERQLEGIEFARKRGVYKGIRANIPTSIKDYIMI
jgi:DNA invertase Pin-like site-specific DNA recombinase